MACESFVEHLVGSLYDVVPKIFPYLNVIGHLPVPAGWGSCLLRLAIFQYVSIKGESVHGMHHLDF